MAQVPFRDEQPSAQPSTTPGAHRTGRLRRFLSWLGIRRSAGTAPPRPSQPYATQPYAPQPYAAPQPPPPPAGWAPGFNGQGIPGAQGVPEAPHEDPTARQARLMTDTLANLAMRDLTLIDSLLTVVEKLEETSDDPELLERLFKIDNLATRMRRNGENLLVLAGQEIDDPRTEPVPLLDVARAAISEISDYNRVQVGRLPSRSLAGSAADDLSHLLAELLDNATAKSPDHAQVVISGQTMDDGRVLLIVEDEGIGLSRHQVMELNTRLLGTPVLDEQVIRHMGLYVVSLLAHQHGFHVQLEARVFRGMSAYVIVPTGLLRSSGPSVPSPGEAPSRAMPVGSSAAELGDTAPAPAPAPLAESDTSSSSLTAAGLPRRSANRRHSLADALPPEPDTTHGDAERENPGSSAQQGPTGQVTASERRAERISADIDGFLAGERAAGTPEDPGQAADEHRT